MENKETKNMQTEELGDEALDEVTGGKGKWSAAKEADMQWKYERAQKGGEKGGFEVWYRSTYGMGSGNLRIALDDLEARKMWIAKGRPEDETIIYGG